MNERYKFKVVIGDWSGDGHSQSDEIAFIGNKPVSELREGYKNSCRKLGVAFNHPHYKNDDWTPDSARLQICTSYEESRPKPEALEILKANGLEFFDEDLVDDDILEFAQLILKFIKISIPDFEWEEAAVKRSEEVEPLNGWWNAELNVQFGYGLYFV